MSLGKFTTLQRVLMRIEPVFHVRALGSMNQEVGRRLNRQHGPAQQNPQPWIPQSKIKRIVDHGTIALHSYIRANRFRSSEQCERLVNQVRPQIKEHTASRPCLFAPSPRPELQTIAVVVRLEQHDAPESFRCEQIAYSLEVTIEAAIMINRKQASAFFRQRNQFGSFVVSRSERLVDDHVAASQQALPRQIEVRNVRRRDHHELNGIGRKQFLNAASDANIRISARSLSSLPLQDGDKPQALNRTDNRSMESASRESEANQANVDGVRFRRHAVSSIMARKNITIKNSIVELVCGSVTGELVQTESGS